MFKNLIFPQLSPGFGRVPELCVHRSVSKDLRSRTLCRPDIMPSEYNGAFLEAEKGSSPACRVELHLFIKEVEKERGMYGRDMPLEWIKRSKKIQIVWSDCRRSQNILR